MYQPEPQPNASSSSFKNDAVPRPNIIASSLPFRYIEPPTCSFAGLFVPTRGVLSPPSVYVGALPVATITFALSSTINASVYAEFQNPQVVPDFNT